MSAGPRGTGWARARGDGIVLFGGSGFLGSHILQRYPGIVSVGRTAPSTSNRHIHTPSLESLAVLDGVPFDRVIFLIGHSDRRQLDRERIPRHEPTAFDFHTIPLVHTLEQLKHLSLKKFVHFSTVLLYDEANLTLPVSETAPIDPYKTRYTFSKYLAEEVCRFYARWVPILNVRLSNMYGPSRRRRFDLIDTLVRQLLGTGRGEVRSMLPERDFVHVEDAADAVMELIYTEHAGTVNLGTGTLTSIREIADVLEAVSGSPITDLSLPEAGPPRFQCDMTTVHRLVDWRPRYAIAEGVSHTYRVMRSWR